MSEDVSPYSAERARAEAHYLRQRFSLELPRRKER